MQHCHRADEPYSTNKNYFRIREICTFLVCCICRLKSYVHWSIKVVLDPPVNPIGRILLVPMCIVHCVHNTFLMQHFNHIFRLYQCFPLVWSICKKWWQLKWVGWVHNDIFPCLHLLPVKTGVTTPNVLGSVLLLTCSEKTIFRRRFSSHNYLLDPPATSSHSHRSLCGGLGMGSPWNLVANQTLNVSNCLIDSRWLEIVVLVWLVLHCI